MCGETGTATADASLNALSRDHRGRMASLQVLSPAIKASSDSRNSPIPSPAGRKCRLLRDRASSAGPWTSTSARHVFPCQGNVAGTRKVGHDRIGINARLSESFVAFPGSDRWVASAASFKFSGPPCDVKSDRCGSQVCCGDIAGCSLHAVVKFGRSPF